MSMIAAGDQSARNAFLTNLRDDSSRPISMGNPTQELDPSDILEVKDLANAIERAERSMLTPLPVPASYSRAIDMFEELGATDDISGPAIHAPYVPTPVPPPPAVAAPTPVPPVPAPSKPPILYVNHEDDAFLQPGPRLRSFAEESLQIQRAEPTLLVRAQSRRKTATGIVVAAFGLIVLFTGGAFAARHFANASSTAVTPATPVATTVIATATMPAKASPAITAKAEAAPTATTAAVPVFDVKSLPTARPVGRK